MKIDSHILFLIIVIGVISAGIVGATLMNSDTSMKQEVFDGITVSVPSDSNFVKVDDGVYKDSNYGIRINTFKNNDSMIDFLKNTKKSKIIPVENQPPQSVAFKKGDRINILVTNGNEGVAVSSKDGGLTAEIANNIVFSNHHKSQKPVGIPFAKQPMNTHKDFNLIMLLIADVDTRIFNVGVFEENVLVVVDNYNEALDQPVEDIESSDSDSESGGDVSDISNQEELNDVLSDPDNQTADASNDNAQDDKTEDSNSSDDVAQATVVSGGDDSSSSNSANPVSSDNAAGGDNAAPDQTVNSNPQSASQINSQPSSNQPQEMSVDDCKNLVSQKVLINHPEFMIDSSYDEVTDGYVFTILNNTNIVGKVTVNALTGDYEPDDQLRQVL